MARPQDALHLPPVVALGLGMGGRFATQLAISFPKKVQGLFLVSTKGGNEVRFDQDKAWAPLVDAPRCTKSPAAIAGRTQVFELWSGAMAQIDRGEAGLEVEELLESVRFGANQLAWGAWNAGPNPTCVACVSSHPFLISCNV